MIMKEEELVALVDKIRRLRSESQTLEIKAANKGCPHRLFDTLSSFSNQDDGGTIVFGISEADDYDIVGVYNVEALEKDVVEQCKQMEPVVRPLFTIAEIDGKVVVSAEIPSVSFSLRPVYYRGLGPLKGAFTRVGESDETMTPYEVYSYDAYHKGIHDDRRVVQDADLSFLDHKLLSSYISGIKNTRPNLSSLAEDEILKLSGLMRDGHPTVAAVMAFSNYPQAFFPQFSVTAVIIPGEEKGVLEDSSSPRFIDSRRFTGNIKDMLDASLSYVIDNRKNAIAFDGKGNRVNIPEYPPVAVREAILNALQHRDYSVYSEGMAVRLELYSDRIEIINSGGIYGTLPMDRLGSIPPETRNPTLSDILEVLGISENRGSGIPTIRSEFKKANLVDPEFYSERGEFKVIFRSYVKENNSAKGIIEFCKTPRSRNELEEFTGLDRTALYYSVLKPFLEEGLLKMTIPEKPKSKFQRFVAP